MEGNPPKLFGVLAQQLLLILFPEEPRIRQARGEDLAVAGDDRRPAIKRNDVGGADEGIGQAALFLALTRRFAADEVFLVGPRGQLDHFGRDIKKRLVKPAEQRHGPFGQPRILDHQPLVGDQHQPFGMGRSGGSLADQVLAFLVIDDHVCGAQFFGIVAGPGNLDLAVRVEAVAHRGPASGDPVDLERHDFAAKQRDDPRERANPAQAFGADRGRAPALALGPGEGADKRGDCLGDHFGGGPARLFDHREKHPVALDQVALGKASLAQEPFERLRRSADPGPLQLFADRSSGGRQVARDQGQAARGGPDGNLA